MSSKVLFEVGSWLYLSDGTIHHSRATTTQMEKTYTWKVIDGEVAYAAIANDGSATRWQIEDERVQMAYHKFLNDLILSEDCDAVP